MLNNGMLNNGMLNNVHRMHWYSPKADSKTQLLRWVGGWRGCQETYKDLQTTETCTYGTRHMCKP